MCNDTQNMMDDLIKNASLGLCNVCLDTAYLKASPLLLNDGPVRGLRSDIKAFKECPCGSCMMTAKPTPLHCVAHDSAHLKPHRRGASSEPELLRDLWMRSSGQQVPGEGNHASWRFHCVLADDVIMCIDPPVHKCKDKQMDAYTRCGSSQRVEREISKKQRRRLILIEACVEYFQSLQACFLTWAMCAFNNHSGLYDAALHYLSSTKHILKEHSQLLFALAVSQNFR